MIPAREMERMMKLQDVILKAMAKKITWIEAAEIAGMSVRNMQRKRQAYQDYGYDGLFDQRRGKRSYHRVPMEIAEDNGFSTATFVALLFTWSLLQWNLLGWRL